LFMFNLDFKVQPESIKVNIKHKESFFSNNLSPRKSK